MSILEELYNGNVVPSERFVKKDGEYARLLNELAECTDKFLKSLTTRRKNCGTE